MNKNNILQNILYFPLTRIIIGLLAFAVIVSSGKLIVSKILGIFEINKDISDIIIAFSVTIFIIFSYKFLFKLYEKREVTEFSQKRFFKSLIIGLIIGSLLQSLTILNIYLNGGYSIISINSIQYLIPPLTMAFASSIMEEILLRGIIFRITEEKLGSYIALFISAVLFGAMHLGNPNSTLIAGIGLAIQAGLLLASAYIYFRNLWFPIAIHFAWNFTQSGIFGANVSGVSISKTLITSKIEGAEWYTGGQFGPEGSVQATFFCFAATVILIVFSHKEGKIILPFWKKSH